MSENDRASGGRGAATSALQADRPAVEKRLEAETRSLSQAASDAAGAVAEEAKALGSEAQHAAEAQAGKVKEAAVSHLDSFADALRAASDELGRNQTGPAADMVSHAASGLEALTRSLHGRSTGDMINTVRQFGRENPIGFLAGSILAGLALGRFASVASAAPASSSDTQSSPPTRPGLSGSVRRNEGNT